MEDRMDLSYAELKAGNSLWRVYGWMVAGLAMTGLIALYMESDPLLIRQMMGHSSVFGCLVVAQFLLVAWLGGWAGRMSPTLSAFAFLLFAGLNGLTSAAIFLVFTQSSIASAFFIAAGMFGIMAAYGYTTRTDLSGIGSLCSMGLVGILLVSIANFWMKSSLLDWVVGFAGIFVFRSRVDAPCPRRVL